MSPRDLFDGPVVELPFGYRVGKRIFDLASALLAFAVVLPILVVAGLLVWIFMGRPILFRQPRPGLNERVFDVLKLRTMSDAVDRDGKLLPDDQRLCRLGRVLRKTSIDELPQLINVIRGEMSLVGPRPLLKEYLPHYTARERLRHRVKPGITGLAQVNGRNSLKWEERLEWDAIYATSASWRSDLLILVKTVGRVLSGRGTDAAPEHPGPLHKYRGQQR